jgi:tetratricopeptide (TPR) repeat protein
VDEKYPLDRVMLNQMARILFLQRKYEEALAALDRVARIDPEDLQMHYTAMLCYRGLGDVEKARHEEALFERFKADEDSQVITADIRRHSPEDNNERQLIHEHVSVDLSVDLAPDALPLPRTQSHAMTAAGGQP